MKFFSILLLFFLCVGVIKPALVQAHVLVHDRTIGAEMHMDPEDDPVAKKQSAFFFEFKDTQNTFDPAQCDCTFLIKTHGATIYSQPLFQNNTKPSLNNANILYTFPQKDIYQVIVLGKPTLPHLFTPFRLVYDVRVDQIADTPASSQTKFFMKPAVYFVGIGMVILLIWSMVKAKIKKT